MLLAHRLVMMEMNITRMHAKHVADEPSGLIARICRTVPIMQARGTKAPRSVAQQFADLQGNNARSVSR